MTVCLNIDQQRCSQDVEVMNQLSRLRLKTKALSSHYLLCMRWVPYTYIYTKKEKALVSISAYNKE